MVKNKKEKSKAPKKEKIKKPAAEKGVKPKPAKKAAAKKTVKAKALPKKTKSQVARKKKITPPREKVLTSEQPVLKEEAVEPQKIKKADVQPEIIPPKIEKPSVVEPRAEPKIEAPTKTIELKLPITVKDFSVRLQEKPSVLIKKLMELGLMAGINQSLDEPVVVKICEKYGYQLKKAPSEEKAALSMHEEQDKPHLLKPRAPIVTLMGHVDHGKTSLLDAIRETKVVESEHGGITQHIGAYRVHLKNGEITFLDTPGHEAFTAMRARGASITDIVVLVVAADDGLMPQTQEAIDHARAAGVPIVVAINKIDKPQVNIDKVKKQLSAIDLLAEDWGGKTITVPVSAKTGEGIDTLLEMIILEAQMLELKSNPLRLARGVVIEAKLTKGRGPVASLLVKNGTLRLNDVIIVGKYYGKIKAMQDDLGRSITQAPPSFPVEVSGLSGVPEVGEQFFVLEDEKLARDLAAKRIEEEKKQQQMKAAKKISLEDIHVQIEAGKLKELKLIIKADVGGSLQAIKDSLVKLSHPEIKLSIIHEGVGNINNSDVILAAVSNALILGFNVNVEESAKSAVDKEGVDVRVYNVIYEISKDIKAALEGILEPKIKKVFVGRAEVRKVFKLSRAGTVAGCFVTKGKISRNLSVSVIRNGTVVFEGSLSSLKRFKDDVREVLEGYECGISLGGFEDVRSGDTIEAYGIEKIARKL
ncbi:MAG: translation initiation factor IF-2 [Candidatus Omnitrophota bacterium]|nr:MAG: translation initiation factor IF-2 [Candidatus Omnitrophota bacterium]